MWNDFVFNQPKDLKNLVPPQELTHTDDEQALTGTVDPMRDINLKVAEKVQYQGNEQGIYHPLFHQVVKLRSNGMIDIFANKDTGIRVDPSTQSINHFANDYKLHIHNQTSWITGYQKEHVHGDSLKKVHGNYWRHAYGDIGFVAEKNLREEVKGSRESLVYHDDTQTVDGDRIIYVKGNAKIFVDGSTYARAKGKMEVVTDSDLSVRASGNTTVNAYKDATMNVGKKLHIKADTVRIDSDKLDMNAEVKVNGRAL